MARLNWDQTGDRLYETGVEKGVLYPAGTGETAGTYPAGYAWNGLTKVTESPSGAEPSPLYADNQKYLELMSTEEFGASIEAYTYPDEFAECDGSAEIATGVSIGQQTRKAFGFCYKTLIGNDVLGTDKGYKLHLVYGCKAKPSSKDNETVNTDPNAATFSWELSTTPVAVTGKKPTAHIVIDSTKVNANDLAELEAILYGTDAVAAVGTEGSEGYVAAVEATVARLPLPAEVATIFATTP
jgi:hypothetical protein